MTKRKTGLGTAAFFQQPQPQPVPLPAQETTEESTVPKPENTPQKVRTTVTLYPDTLAALEAIKIYGRRQGTKLTYSDILDEAIRDLSQKWGIET